MRPMAGGVESFDINIEPEDRAGALGRSEQALGNGKYTHIRDILFVDPETFEYHAREAGFDFDIVAKGDRGIFLARLTRSL